MAIDVTKPFAGLKITPVKDQTLMLFLNKSFIICVQLSGDAKNKSGEQFHSCLIIEFFLLEELPGVAWDVFKKFLKLSFLGL